MSNNSFQTFNDFYNNYPKLANGVNIDSSFGLPTNSWMQNAISSNTNPNQRLFNAVPWMWKVNYADSGASGIYQLDSVSNPITTINQGNIIQLQNFNLGIQVYDSNKTAYGMKSINDFGAEFSSDVLSCYPSKGSVFANFTFRQKAGTNTDAVVNFVGYGIQNYSTVGKVTSVNVSYALGSIYNFDTFQTSPSGSTRVSGSFYDGYVSSNELIDVIYTYSTTQDVFTLSSTNVSALGYNVIVSNPLDNVYTVTPTPPIGTTITVNYSAFTTIVVYNINGVIYTIVANYTQGQGIVGNPQITPPDFLVTSTKSIIKKSTYLIYGPNEFIQKGNELIAQNYSGLLQIVLKDENLPDYRPYFGSYVTSITVDGFKSNGSFNMNVTSSRNKNLYVLPNHWNTYGKIIGLNKTNYPTVSNIIYGNLTYYEISGNVNITSSLTVPSKLITKSVDGINTSQLINDIKLNSDPVTLNGPYQYGQNTFTLARLFLYAQEAGIANDTVVSTAIDNVMKASKQWLNNQNTSSSGNAPPPTGGLDPSQLFYLQNEPYWGGIIVPADYLNKNSPNVYPNGNFGNSYYNDHHFHWGYMFYTWVALFDIGYDIITQNLNNIISLLRDVVNPNSTKDGYKTRHKDWYSGHSFATGMEPSNPNTATGPIERQQESCSEAIHCYYSAYLIANRIKTLGKGPNDINFIINAAAVCLDTEIKALQQYYFCLAPGSKIGVFNQVGGVGIILNDGKAHTLDWGMQPDTFNGRSIGIYTIQALPFSDISYQQISPEWVNKLTNVNPSYTMNEKLILDLANKNYSPILYPNEVDLNLDFNLNTDSWYWCTVGAKTLCYGNNAISNNGCQQLYSIIQKRQNMTPTIPILKQFDSISHTWYIMNSFQKLSSFTNNTIIINSGSNSSNITNTMSNGSVPLIRSVKPAVQNRTKKEITQQSPLLPFPKPSCKTLLKDSPFSSQCLIQVPIYKVGVLLKSDNQTIKTIYYQIIDTYSHFNNSQKCIKHNKHNNGRTQDKCKINCKINNNNKCNGNNSLRCLETGVKPCDYVVTNLETNLNTVVMINAQGNTFQDKAINIGNGVTADGLLAYSAVKLGLAKILFGKFDLKYLRQLYNEKFFKNLSQSQFCIFLPFFTDPVYGVVGYNQYFLP